LAAPPRDRADDEGEGPFEPPAGIDHPNWGQHDPVGRDPLADYLRTAIYPPQSRPLGPQNEDLLEPDKRHEDFVPSEDGAVEVRFTADRYFVTGGEPLTSYLEVRRDGRPVPVTITTAFAAVLVPGKTLDASTRIPLTFTDAGGLHTNVFAPGALPGLSSAVEMGVYIELDHGGAVRPRASFLVHVTPTRAIPARFTGVFRDAIEDGSLVIRAGLDVHRAGYYLIDCNLYDARDRPVAWTRFKGQLPAGRTEAPLLFFGKVLVDAGAEPPFHIGQLRGQLFTDGNDPDTESLPPFEGHHVTRAYALGDLSSAEWDSPEKQTMIRLLREEAERSRGGAN
ncbi:MAG: hypothetical protein K8M05_30560, partial [Deltaproteobacteria bacterium]|nr:hypothetical protein [Kofleriaceae bacterium]